MRSRVVVNLLLLLAVVALALIARYEPGIEAPEETDAITALKADDIQRIHLNRPVRDDLVLVRRSPQDWYLERPARLPADSFKVNALLRLAGQKPQRSYAATDLDLARVQLEPPYATAILNDTAVEFGSRDPIDGLRYVRVLDRIHLVPDNYLPLMEAGFSQFVRQRLFDEQARIVSLDLPGLRISRDGVRWKTDPPTDAGADALQQLLENWQGASAISILPADAGRTGEPVTIRLKDRESPVELQIVERRPELVLARPDWGIQYRMGDRADAMLTVEAPGEETAD